MLKQNVSDADLASLDYGPWLPSQGSACALNHCAATACNHLPELAGIQARPQATWPTCTMGHTEVSSISRLG